MRVFPLIKSFFPISQTSSPSIATFQAQQNTSSSARDTEKESTALNGMLAGKGFVCLGLEGETCKPR